MRHIQGKIFSLCHIGTARRQGQELFQPWFQGFGARIRCGLKKDSSLPYFTLPTSRAGFTLIELLVVIAIIGLLSSVLAVGMNRTRVKARVTTRKANLMQIQKALELYYDTNGSYPIGYYTSEAGDDASVTYVGDVWIPGLVPTYTAKLPRDPLGGDSPECSGWKRAYHYRGVDGRGYKMYTHCSMEGLIPAVNDTLNDPARDGGPNDWNTSATNCDGVGDNLDVWAYGVYNGSTSRCW